MALTFYIVRPKLSYFGLCEHITQPLYNKNNFRLAKIYRNYSLFIIHYSSAKRLHYSLKIKKYPCVKSRKTPDEGFPSSFARQRNSPSPAFWKGKRDFALCGERLRALPLDPASFWKRSAVPTPQIVHCNTKT